MEGKLNFKRESADRRNSIFG